MATASCSYSHGYATFNYPSQPRYLVNTSAEASVTTAPHKRSGILKTTSQQAIIARQRSQALMKSVNDGEITIEAILAFPIDWQGIANELQWTKSRMATIVEECEEEDVLATSSPLSIKTRASSPKQQKRDRHSVWASNLPSLESSPSPTLSSNDDSKSDFSTSTVSVLGLQLDPSFSSPPSSTSSQMEYSLSSDDMDECPSTPELFYRPSSPSSLSCASTCSASSVDSPLATPIRSSFVDLHPIDDPTFELESYCSVFNHSSDPKEKQRSVAAL